MKTWTKNKIQNILIKGAIICALFLYPFFLANAQNVGLAPQTKKSFQLTLGASTGVTKFYFSNDYKDTLIERNVYLDTPPLHLYGEWVRNRTMIGVATGFESIVTTLNDSTSLRVKGKQTTTYIFAGLRFSYIVYKTKRNNLYMGSRLNYIWSNSNYIPRQNAPFLIKPNRLGIQLYTGNRYFFSDKAAFTMELAIGRPFFALAGFSFIIE